MAKRLLSTGLKDLDRITGGLTPGDVFLGFVSGPGEGARILHAASATVPNPLLLAAGPALESEPGVPAKAKVFSASAIKSSALPRAAARFVSSNASRGSLIILDDLSFWKPLLGGSEKHLVELFLTLARFASRRQSVLLTTVIRSSLGRDTLIRLKDASTICLDFLLHQNHIYCVPLALAGRYAPFASGPDRVDLSRRSAGMIPAEEPPGEMPPEPSGESVFAPGAEQYEKMFREASDAMVLFELAGEYRDLNARALDLLGYPLEDLRQMNPFSLLVPGKRLTALRFLVELRKRRRASLRTGLLKRNGREIPVEFRASVIGGRLALGILRDLSEEQRLENILRQRQEDYRQIVEKLPYGVLITSGEKPVYANDSFLRLFGYGAIGELSEIRTGSLFSPQEGRGTYRAALRSSPAEAEVACLKKDGTQFACIVNFQSISYEGRDCLQVTFLDITRQKEVLSTLERFKQIVHHSPAAIAVIREGAVAYVNDALLDLFAFQSPDPLIGLGSELFLAEPAREEFVRALTRRKTSPSVHLCAGLRADGSTFDCELVLVSAPGTRSGDLLAFYRDVTQLRQTEKVLRQRLAEMTLLREVIPSIQGSLDLQKLPQAALLKIMEALSFEMGGIYIRAEKGDRLDLAFHRNIPATVWGKIGSLDLDEGIGAFIVKTLSPHTFEIGHYPSYLPFRSLFAEAGIREITFLPLLAGETLVGMALLASRSPSGMAHTPELLTAVGTNLGNTLQNSTTLGRVVLSEKRMHELLDASPDIFYRASPSGAFDYVNPAIERLIGHPPKDFYRNPSLWLSLVHPDDKRILLERTAHLGETQGRLRGEYRVLPRGKATYRWVRDTAVEASTGALLLGTIADITDERQIVAEMAQLKGEHAEVLAGVQEGVAVYDRQLRCLGWNAAMEKITGLKELEVIGRSASDTLPGYQEQAVLTLLEAALRGEAAVSDEIRVPISQTGREGYIVQRFYPMGTHLEKTRGVLVIVEDVSSRKLLEHEMRQSEQVLSNVIDTMGDILIITDLKGNVLQVNRAFLRSLGYSRGEAAGCEFPYPWLIEKEMGRFVLWISNLRERSWLHDFDMTWKAKDGRLIPMSLSTTLLRNSLGEPIAMLNIARDITERTRLMKDLETRNRQIEMINRIISKANQTMDFDEIFTTIAREIQGIAPSDLITVELLSRDSKSMTIYAQSGKLPLRKGEAIPLARSLSNRVISEGKQLVVSDLLQDPNAQTLLAVAKGLRSQVSLPIHLKGNVIGTLNIASREPHTYSDDHATMLEPISQQIGAVIDRVQLFRQVSEDSAYIHNLLNSIDSIVYTVDTSLRISEFNKAWVQFMREASPGEQLDHHGMNLFDVLPDENLKVLFQNVVRQLLTGRIKIFSQEYTCQLPSFRRTYQLTINPMVIEKKITGLVFTHTDISALKQTEADLKKSNQRLLALNEIAALINTSLDMEKMLEAAIPLLAKLIGADGIIVYLREDRDGGDLLMEGQVGFDMDTAPSIFRLRARDSATGDVVAAKRPLYIRRRVFDDDRIMPENRQILRSKGVEAVAIIPLVTREKVVGALDIFYGSEQSFSEDERQILDLVGNQFGIAIENAVLYTELRSQVTRLSVLYELSRELTSTLDLNQIFHSVHQHVRNVVPYQSLTIELYDAATRTVTPVYQVESAPPEELIASREQEAVPLPEGSPQERVVTTGRSTEREDRRAMFTPMQSKDTILGILSVEAGPEMKYTDTHLKLLESISNLAAIALEKGKLYEETLQKSIEIQRRNKELDDFTYVVSHDLKEPLISVEGFSKILQADYQDIIQAEGKEYLDSIVGATTRMKGLIDDLLLLSRVSRPSESFKNVSMKEILREIAVDMKFTIRQKGVQLVVPDELPMVYGNETHLKIVLRNLIGNGIKFTNAPVPRVEIAFQNAENNAYLFSVRDNGIGIDKEFYEKIFVIFQRLHRREEYEGTGAGLAIVKKIIEKHNGKIWVESELGKGTTFYFTVPRAQTHES